MTEKNTTVHRKLNAIQTKLSVPKTNYHAHLKYHYRNLDDILQGVKPALLEHKVTLVITDSLEMIGTRYYIKATATLTCSETGESICNVAYAREDDGRKNTGQLTGAASSYARKYALNGLLAIDDNKDADYLSQYTKKDGADEEIVDESDNKELAEEFKDSFHEAEEDKQKIIVNFMQKRGLTMDSLAVGDKAMIEELMKML